MERLEKAGTLPLLVFANGDGTTALFDPVIVRAKYNVHVGGTVETAVGLAVRTLTVHATARAVELIPQVHLSTHPYQPTDAIRLQPYLDLGFTINAVSDADARWGLGVDAACGDRFVLGLAFLGRSAIGGVLPFRKGSVSLFDAAVTGRVALWADRLSAVAGVLVPLDRGEKQDFDVVPTVGFEFGF